MKTFLLKSGTSVSTFSTLFIILLDFIAKELVQEEEIKGIQIGMEVVRLFLFVEGMMLYPKNPKPPV
jgi:hypothetical protein